LPSGSRLVLYSDGLVERRGESPDVGLARLADWARELRPRPSEEFADELLRRMRDGDDYTDDVALLVVDLNGHGHADGRP
jgi:serine phosphatase RsbU (regulator of sigma subunit)